MSAMDDYLIRERQVQELVDALQAERARAEQAERRRTYWEDEARRYAVNVEHWQGKAEGAEACISMVIASIGGLVEGRPTARINFLQRVRELVRAEAALATLRAVARAFVNLYPESAGGPGSALATLRAALGPEPGAGEEPTP